MRKIALLLGCFLAVRLAAAPSPGKSDLSEPFFRSGRIRLVEIELPVASLPALKQGQRAYVRAVVREGGMVWREVGVRIKGQDTFQPLERKPSLTLKFNEFVEGQEFHGLAKLALNNSIRDPSYMREVLAGELFREAGLPAARAAVVRVRLNGRDLGFYNLVEGMNKGFLKRAFGNGAGNLYEGEGQDVDQALEQENGDDTSRRELQRLVAAAQAPAGERIARLREVLDLDQFTSYLAMEMLLSSVDGYAFMRDNYRIYHPPKTSRLVLLPHGLESTFGNGRVVPPTGSLLVKAVWDLPEFRRDYLQRLAALQARVWRVDMLQNRLEGLTERLVEAVPDPALAQRIREEAARLSRQIRQQPELISAELRRLNVTPP